MLVKQHFHDQPFLLPLDLFYINVAEKVLYAVHFRDFDRYGVEVHPILQFAGCDAQHESVLWRDVLSSHKFQVCFLEPLREAFQIVNVGFVFGKDNHK